MMIKWGLGLLLLPITGWAMLGRASVLIQRYGQETGKWLK